MKRENVFETDSPTLEMETQTQRPTQQGQQFPFVNGNPMYPYQAIPLPNNVQFQPQQPGFTISGNPHQPNANQFAPPYFQQGFPQQQQPYPNNYYQPIAANAPGFYPYGYPAPFVQPYNGQPYYPTQQVQAPFNNQFVQPMQQQFAGTPTPQPFNGNIPNPAYQPAINIADGQLTMLPYQNTPATAKNGHAYPTNGERDFISWFPTVNILETDRSFKIEICVPGVTRDNCRIFVDKNNILRVSGTRRWNQETESIGFTRKDFNYGSFASSFVLTENLQKEKISSSCRNGLLIINIPKQEIIEREEASLSDISVN